MIVVIPVCGRVLEIQHLLQKKALDEASWKKLNLLLMKTSTTSSESPGQSMNLIARNKEESSSDSNDVRDNNIYHN